MSGKYSSVVKVRKQELDKAETNLLKAKQRQKANEEALMKANAEYLSLNLPMQGSVELLKQSLEFKEIAKNVKDAAKEKVRLSAQEITHYQHLYKNAHLSYEKIKYLENEEFKELQTKLKKAEQKALDDIATSKYFRERKQYE